MQNNIAKKPYLFSKNTVRSDSVNHIFLGDISPPAIWRNNELHTVSVPLIELFTS